MAFTQATLGVIVQPIGGEGMRFISYRTDDGQATVTATGYFAGAGEYGVRVNDLIFVSPIAAAFDPYILVVDSVDTAGDATGTIGDDEMLKSIYDPNGDGIFAIAQGGTNASTAAGARTNLGLEIGTDVQAWNAALDDISGLAKTDSNIIVGNGTNWVAESGATARASLGLTIGTDVQAYDANLTTLSSGTTTLGTTGLALLGAATDDAAINVLDQFTPSYTGGVARTLRSKIEEIPSVKDFGAVGDGVTDDTAAFSAAAQAAVAFDTLGPPNNTSTVPRADTCAVRVPAGDYNLTSLVDVNNKNVTWILDNGARFAGTISDFLNGRTMRPGVHVTHGYPYGILDDAAGFTVTFGGGYSDKPSPITGVASPAALADYAQRDGVALIGAAYSQAAIADKSTANYTSTTATIAALSADELLRLRKGTVIETKHSPKYIGVLESWTSTVLTVKDGWYEALNSAAGIQTPANGTGLLVGAVNKIWGANFVTNLSLAGVSTQAIGAEISNRNLKGASTSTVDDATNRVWGYLAASVAEGTADHFKSQAAFVARGWWHYGYVADSQDVGYYYKTTSALKEGIRLRSNFGGTALYVEDTSNDRRWLLKGTGDVEAGTPTTATGSGRYIAFHTSGNNSAYDTRILASGGSATLGMGTLTYNAIDNVFGGVVRPTQDNVRTLGSASFRWSEVFAGNATINTSDEREKQDIEAVPDEWLDAWGDVRWSRYKWKHAVEEKGETARWHVGLVAQQIERAFAARGLDAFEIGLLCRDPVIETAIEIRQEEQHVFEEVEIDGLVEEVVDDRIVQRRTKKTVRRPKERTLPVVDESGVPVMHDELDVEASTPDHRVYRKVPLLSSVPVVETVDVEVEVERETGEWRYGVRYEEALALEAAWTRRELSRT
ncbi:tail fiber domain-containing protein [Chelativorans xinjiangense]|uniref:tail fiber domain-containing protein n=1 Tax=Chelativorans xinjiangense TaxID=2681485 RepID=UPI001357E7B1|nr:tail fiber domain-containing protein [Chelativorans xinjiangense]